MYTKYLFSGRKQMEVSWSPRQRRYTGHWLCLGRRASIPKQMSLQEEATRISLQILGSWECKAATLCCGFQSAGVTPALESLCFHERGVGGEKIPGVFEYLQSPRHLWPARSILGKPENIASDCLLPTSGGCRMEVQAFVQCH